MRKILWVLLLVPAFGIAESKDTLPLQTRGAPDNSGSIVAPKPQKPAALDPAPAPGENRPYVGSITTYGSSRINEVTLREFLGKDLDLWVSKGLASDNSALEMEKKFIEKVKAKYGFAFAEFSIIQYFQPENMVLHITLDVVEPQDVSRRMPFAPEPKGEVADPGGLIKEWATYEDLALGLVETGELQPEAEKCAALHCPFGHKHPKLRKYEKIFVEGAKKSAGALIQVLKGDSRAEYRAAAVYVLAYWKDQKKKLVDVLVEATRDFDPLVRNNALRVLGDIAEFHTEIAVPIGPILPALDYPKVSDRSKALYVAYLLALNSNAARDEILKSSVGNLISLLENKQPDHRELAHNILRKISGKEFTDVDVRAWTAWYKKLPGREVSKSAP